MRVGRVADGMPAFGSTLKLEDIQAVADYILSLGGSSTKPSTSAVAAVVLPPEVEKGRALFFEATRYGGCGRCHEVNQRGVSVGPDVVKSAANSDLRNGSTSRVKVARPSGEDPFPCLVVEESKTRVRVYDLTSKLPVLRTFAAGQVELSATGAGWSHSDAVRDYTESELSLVGGYLSWLRQR
jgi:mono/diheme cytochrome c family protein